MLHVNKPIKKQYYKIGEVAKVCGVTATAIRKHEGVLKGFKRGKKGTRFYTREQLIKYAKAFILTSRFTSMELANIIIKSGIEVADNPNEMKVHKWNQIERRLKQIL